MKTTIHIGTLALILALTLGLPPRAEAAVTASGGNYTNDIPGYRIHVFTNSATASNLVVTTGGSVQVLVVGGGGGGGKGYYGGGGGAGGLIYSNAYSVSDGSNYAVVVGGGGAGATVETSKGTNGADSSFGGVLVAKGGGGGGSRNAGTSGGAADGADGGSGGGIGMKSSVAGQGTQTNFGGFGNNGAPTVGRQANSYGCGGGGAGAAAPDNPIVTLSYSVGGVGGDGKAYSIAGPVTYYAGGGGGGSLTASASGSAASTAGGLGGGGRGGRRATGYLPDPGVNGTGGGGGGGAENTDNGATGGSGIVVVRYAAPNAWTYSMPITFTNDARLNTLTNFPALVILDTNKVNYSQFLASGQDLRFMDGNGAELAYEVESWMSSASTSSNSYIWVQIPTMTSGCSITAYWGNASASFPSYRTNGAVWANGYEAVWHLKDGSTLGTVKDSTTNGYTASISGTVSAVTGRVDGAADFNGTAGNYLATTFNPSARLGNNLTIRALVYPRATGNYKGVAGDHGGSFQGLVFLQYEGSSWNCSAGLGAAGWANGSTMSLVLNGWNDVSAVYSNSGGNEIITGYKDGLYQSQGSKAGSISHLTTFAIGRAYNSSDRYFNGIVDELRVSSVARSANWVWAEYANMASNAFFNGYGTVIAPATATAPPQIQNQAPTGVGTNGATFNARLVTNGFENATVYVAWGQTNGAVSGSWAATNWWNAGDWTNGSYPSTNMTLEPNANYYYRFGATNSTTNVAAGGYQYLITGEVTVQPTDPTGRVTLADTAAFTVYRPSSCTNEALIVAYTLNGTATNGTHYTNSPTASGTNGTVTIAAGQTNAVITVYPLNLGAPEQTVLLTLVSSNYAIGVANSATCTLAAIGTQYYTSQIGDWTNSATWGGSGPPSSGDSGLVRHGSAYGNTVLATTNLGAAGNYASITVATNGWLSAKAAASSTGTIIANPVTFDGGKIGSGAWDAPGGEWTGPITITANGLIAAPGRQGSPKLSGKVSGPGGITITMPDQDWSVNGLTLSNAANDFLGNVVVTQGCLTLAVSHALPTGKVVNVYSDGRVRCNVTQAYPLEPVPVLNLYGGGLVAGLVDGIGIPYVINVSALGASFTHDGWCEDFHVTGPITIAAGGTLRVGHARSNGTDWYIDGRITGEGAVQTYTYDLWSGNYKTVLTCASNTFSGGTSLADISSVGCNNLAARAEGAFGTGPITVGSNTVIELDKTVNADWTLTNTLAGRATGYFKVEDGVNYRLTAVGTVSPGTNTGHVAILRIDGKFAFGKNGGTPSTLAIDVASVGTTPGVDHDQFTVDHPDVTLAASITNCALVVSRVPSPVQMNGLTLTILSAPGVDFSAYGFASTNGLGAGGSVVCGNGSIAVTWTAQTPIINNGAYSNLAATSCDVSGYLSSTGDSPTVVRCYWGTNSAGINGWGYTNDLGTQAIGTVWTSLTNLTSTVKYYYRFHAANDAGEYWSVATSNVTALGDVYWNDAATGNWNADNANTWGQGTGVYPKEWLNDHVTIDSHTVTLMNSLTAGSTAPADITLATNGILQPGTDNATYSIDSPMTLNVGLVNLPASRTLNLNGPVTLQNTSTARIESTTCTINGPISGSGKLVTWFRYWQGGLSLANANSTNWTGSLDVRPGDAAGSVTVTTNGGLGRATANVYQAFNLYVTQNHGAAPKPTINVYPGGVLLFGYGLSNNTNVTSDIPVVMNGGQWASADATRQWYGNFTQSGTVTLNSNTVVGCGNYAIRWNFAGPIDGPGQFILQSPGESYGVGITTLGGANTYAGGTWVQSGLLIAKNTNAFGSGTVQVDYNTNAASHGLIQLAATTPSSNYWTLANNLVGGCGTNVALQVENGASTNTLTLLGTVDPGTNGVAVTTNSTGIYRIDGSVAFGTGSRLKIHIADTNGVAGVDFDRLAVDHNLTGLGNATLEVAVSSSLTPEMLNGLSFVVVSNATALAGTFGSVESWQGKVVYNQPTGTVKLMGMDPGSVFRFR